MSMSDVLIPLTNMRISFYVIIDVCWHFWNIVLVNLHMLLKPKPDRILEIPDAGTRYISSKDYTVDHIDGLRRRWICLGWLSYYLLTMRKENVSHFNRHKNDYCMHV